MQHYTIFSQKEQSRSCSSAGHGGNAANGTGQRLAPAPATNKQCLPSTNLPCSHRLSNKNIANIFNRIHSDSIPPRYDKIRISLGTPLPPHEVKQQFVTALGTPKPSYTGNVWTFTTSCGSFELTTNRKKTKFFHVISLRNLELLQLLEPVIANFPPYNNTPAAKISSAEIAFDVPLPGLPYEMAERLLQKLTQNLQPFRNKYADLTVKSGDKFKKTSDGAMNGKFTVYIGKHKKLSTGLASNSSWKGKAYTKAFYDANGTLGPWQIRFEVTLADRALSKVGGNALSFSPDAMQGRLKGLTIATFWKFEGFDFPTFLNDARHVSAQKQYDFYTMRGIILLHAHLAAKKHDYHFSYAVNAKQRAFLIAKLLNDTLAQRIHKGTYKTAPLPDKH